MHVIVGALIVAASFLLSIEYMDATFSGFWNTYALILLAGVPVGLTIASYRFGVFRSAARVLWATITRQTDRERQGTLADLVVFGREVRGERGREAYSRLDASADPVFRTLGRHVLQRAAPEEIEADALLLGRRELDEYRGVERMLTTLGSAAPAVGMTGTVIGLIQLLVGLENFAALGAGMAIALLTTLYGLVLGHVVYLPAARLVAEFGQSRAETIGLVADGMLKLARRRPVHEIETVLETNGSTGASGRAQNGIDGAAA